MAGYPSHIELIAEALERFHSKAGSLPSTSVITAENSTSDNSKPWDISGEVWVPDGIRMAPPDEGHAHEIHFISAAHSQQHTGLLTVVDDSNNVIFRRYLHTESDITLSHPIVVTGGFLIFMGAGSEAFEINSLSCCLNATGKTVKL
jgi:hypothetical protein